MVKIKFQKNLRKLIMQFNGIKNSFLFLLAISVTFLHHEFSVTPTTVNDGTKKFETPRNSTFAENTINDQLH